MDKSKNSNEQKKINKRNSKGSTEIDIKEFADEKFKHICPKCKFRFN